MGWHHIERARARAFGAASFLVRVENPSASPNWRSLVVPLPNLEAARIEAADRAAADPQVLVTIWDKTAEPFALLETVQA